LTPAVRRSSFYAPTDPFSSVEPSLARRALNVQGQYRLANHVFVCRDEGYVVILDLKQDRYFSLEATRTAVLRPVLPGWPAQLSDRCSGAEQEVSVGEGVTPSLSQGWLVEVPAASKEAAPVRLPLSETELLRDEELEGTNIDAQTVKAFLAASIFAKFALRFWRFERLVDRVAERTAARPAARGALDIARARQVRARPFVAHCWAQHQNIVLNDTAEHVGGYIPIIMV
jgi:hypothetical protein